MALVIKTEPTNNASVNNEMLFAIYEATKAVDAVTYPNYQYVCDVYVSSVLIGRIKARPDPTYNMGIFDISRLLQKYATYGLKANYASATETYTPKISYLCKFGEEYSDTLYTNLLVDGSDREAYTSYEIRPFSDADVMPDVDNDFATSAPDTIYSSKDVKWQLLPFWDNVSGISNFNYKFYDAAGVQQGSTGTISAAGYVGKTILQLNVSFLKLSAGFLSAEEKTNTDYLEVYGNGETIRIKYQCDKYPVYVLAWLNKYGAYDSYAFGMVSRKQTEISRKEFEQLNYKWDASGVMSYSANGVFYGGRRGFATDMKISLKMTSHLLNDNEYTWLSELFHSPDVYLFDSVLDKFHPVSIQENNYEYRNYLNSRLKPLEFTVNYADGFNSQRL